MEANREGIKYFINIITRNREIPYIPIEIREIIWDYANNIGFMKCKIANIIIKLKYKTKET